MFHASLWNTLGVAINAWLHIRSGMFPIISLVYAKYMVHLFSRFAMPSTHKALGNNQSPISMVPSLQRTLSSCSTQTQHPVKFGQVILSPGGTYECIASQTISLWLILQNRQVLSIKPASLREPAPDSAMSLLAEQFAREDLTCAAA